MTYTIMTEYNKVVNCSQILRDILVIASQKSLELIKKHINLTVKRTIENIWRSDETNAYIKALRKQEKFLCRGIFFCCY